jgi:flagellar hook-associated protein 2
MVTTTSPTTTFSGLASGIDSSAIIESLVQIAKLPITRLQDKQSVNTKISTKFSSLKTKLEALKTAAQALDTRTETLVNKGSSSDEKIAKITGTGGSGLGSYRLVVDHLAQAQRTYSDPISSASTAGAAGLGEITLQVGTDDPVVIQVLATDTLTDIAGKINTSGAGVSAGIMFDGTNYRLQVTGTATGADNAITITEDATLSLGLNNPANTLQVAQDAAFTLDGFPVTSKTNTVTDALPGVSLTLSGPGTVDITLERDPDGLKTKLDAFVTAYNELATMMGAEFAKIDGLSKPLDSLSGDSTLRSLQSQLRSTISQNWSSVSPSFPTLMSAGITLDRDNRLSIDQAALSKAVGGDYEGLATMLVGSTSQRGLMGQVSDLVDQLTSVDGPITTRINSLAQANKEMDRSIESIQLRVDSYQEMLTRQFAQLESISARLQTQGNSLISIFNKM